MGNTERSKVEVANALTHLVGTVVAVPASWFLVSRGFKIDFITGFSMVVFSVGMFILYLASTLYHWVTMPRWKRFLRHFDHANIYILIAASYTPVWLCTVGPGIGYTMCVVLWIVALAGIIYKIIALGKYPKFSLALYLIMGWSVVFAAKPVWENLSLSQILWIVCEGLCYTVGTYFYSHKEKPYFHVIWHLFVLAGTASHYIAMIPISMGE